MSGTNQDGEEPMDVDSQDGMASPQDKDEVELTLSLQWPQSDQPQKLKSNLEKKLQSWLNKRKNKADCTVVNIRKDGIALIKVSPSPALKDLLELNGQTLTNKDGNKVTIRSISLGSPNLDSQGSDVESMKDSSSVPGPQADEVQDEKQSSPVWKDGDPQGKNSAEEGEKKPFEHCLVSVGVYWYVNHIYKEEIKRIEKDNKVKIEANVTVKLVADQEDGSPENALSEFTKLVQSSLSDSCGSVIPLKFVDPDQWSDATRVIQNKQSKLLLTLSSEEVTVCGPSQSQDPFAVALNAMQRNASFEEYKPALQDASLKIDMTIKDPLVDAGFIMEKSHWRQITTTHAVELTKIKEKFGVNLRESSVTQDKVSVTASYSGPGGNASLESHAVRALLHLYQKIATSSTRFSQPSGAAGFIGSVDKFSNGLWSEGASSGPAFNGESTSEGATGGDKDDICPICLGPFTNKKQLKCKHGFCKRCLQEAEKHSGPICPVCKDVYGVMEGDQPDGKMTWTTSPVSLSGFPDCGHIYISYDIPGGVQTKKHPNPGQRFYGTRRSAYLPDNKEGNEVLQLLKKAFDQKLIFTVGASRTTGAENQVTWNDIHHKTSTGGGPELYGYPDPDYLKRVKEELKAKGIM